MYLGALPLCEVMVLSAMAVQTDVRLAAFAAPGALVNIISTAYHLPESLK